MAAKHEGEQIVGARTRVYSANDRHIHNGHIGVALGLANGGTGEAAESEAGSLERLEHKHTPADM